MGDAEKLISVHRLQQCLLGEPVVNIGYDAEEFGIIRTQWAEAFEALDAIDTKTGIVAKTVKTGKVKVICSYFQKDFLNKFGAELTMTDPTKLESELLSIIGEPDAAEKENRLRLKFNAMSRRLENSEKFSAYLTRLKNVAEKLTTDETTRTFIVRQQFLQTLSPGEQEFLLIHGEDGEKDVDAQATLLDSKRQHLVSKVNLIERQKMDEFEQTQLEMMSDMRSLRQTITELRNDKDALARQVNERPTTDFGNQFKALHAAVNKISKSAGGDKTRPRVPKPYDKNAQRCTQCGLRGHAKETCFPKTKLKCFKCGELGHTQFAAMFHPQTELKSKND